MLALSGLTSKAALLLFEALIPTIDGWTVFWPFNGLVLAVLLLCPRRYWFSILGGFLAACGRDEWMSHDSLSETAAVIFSNTLEILIPAYALPPFRGLQTWLLQPHLVRRFIVYAVVAPPAALSLFAASFYHAYYHAGFWPMARMWGLADAVGAALWVPMVLILFSRETYDLFRWPRIVETLGVLGLLAAATWFAFSQAIPIKFLPYPVLLLVGLRLNFSGAVLGANLLSVIACSLTLHGHGPLHHGAGQSVEDRTIILQVYLTLAVLMVFPLSVTLIERKNFELKLREAYTKMERLAIEDSLTSAANRRRFDEVLAAEWARGCRERRPLALIMIDVDKFKAYNDQYGHLAGDDCLRAVAAAMARCPRRSEDLLARYGGEEFALLLPGADVGSLTWICEELRAQVEALGIVHEGSPYGHVSISAGWASVVPGEGDSSDALIAAADRCLYVAKQNGRNCVEGFAVARVAG